MLVDGEQDAILHWSMVRKIENSKNKHSGAESMGYSNDGNNVGKVPVWKEGDFPIRFIPGVLLPQQIVI